MLRSRAVLFDLDDTLYPASRFVRSGFKAVALHVERTQGVERHRVLAALLHAFNGPSRGRELQVVLERFSLSERLVPELVRVIRTHQPTIRLPHRSARVLRQLRAGWRLAIVTNGIPEIQARKVQALGLAALVDGIVFAREHGTGAGKPEPAPFLAALRQLDVRPDRAVFVGDDERCDIFGAARVGMRTVHCGSVRVVSRSRYADAVVKTLTDVPRIAAALVSAREKRGLRHVA